MTSVQLDLLLFTISLNSEQIHDKDYATFKKIWKILWFSHELYAMIWIKVKPSEGGECVLPKSSYNSVSGTFECQRINYGMYHWNKCSEELSASYLYFFQRQKKNRMPSELGKGKRGSKLWFDSKIMEYN